MPGLSLRILGGFELQHDGETVLLPPGCQRVLAYVAMRDIPAIRPMVAGTLWLDVPDDRAMGNLRSALWRLRRPGLRVIEAVGPYLQIGRDVAVDFRELVAVARALLDDETDIGTAQANRLVLGNELLCDWYDDWVTVEREHFRQLRLQALEHLATAYLDAGLYGRATEAALAAVSTEPLRESAHRALISVHMAQGNQSEAIHQYAAYRRLMRDELDLPPSPQMEQLIGSLADRAV